MERLEEDVRQQKNRRGMKRLFMVVCLVVVGCGSLSACPQRVVDSLDSKVFTRIETNPQFPGGTCAVMEFLANNIKYPTECVKNRIEGRVWVTFIVDATGKVCEVKTKESPHPLLAKEAVRVVKLMPDWLPGRLNGKPVRVKMTVPIRFRLQTQSGTEVGDTQEGYGRSSSDAAALESCVTVTAVSDAAGSSSGVSNKP